MRSLQLFNKEPANIWSRFQDDMSDFVRSMEDYWPSTVIREDLGQLGREWVPSVNIREEDKQIVIDADIPGVDPKDIEVSVDDSVLSIKGERSEEKKESGEGYMRTECSRGVFYRRFALPDTANPDKITAKGKNGVLTITVEKLKTAPKHKAKMIKIES